MPVTGLDHVSVTCADLGRSVAFYHGLLGIPIRDQGQIAGAGLDEVLGVDGAAAAYADLELGEGRTLELLAYERPAGEPLAPVVHRPGAGHLSLRVEGLDELVATLRAGGVELLSEAPVELDEPGFWHGARVIYARDPDGVTVELIEWAAGA